jgi:hypothetical protein
MRQIFRILGGSRYAQALLIVLVYAIFGAVYGKTRKRRLLSPGQGMHEVDMHRSGLQLRERLSSVPATRLAETKNHTHARAAALRNQATTLMEAVCLTAGAKPYFESMSAQNMRLGRSGNRLNYHAKDLNLPVRVDPVEDDSVMCLVDTDYFVDMPKYLIDNHRPILMYTIVPSKAADTTENSTYWFENNEYVEVVSGGATYRHRLWDWNGDVLAISGRRESESWFDEWDTFLTGGMFSTYTRSVFLVEHRTLSTHKSLVLLQPIHRAEGLEASSSWATNHWCLGWLARALSGMEQPIRERHLQRLAPLKHGFNVMGSTDANGQAWVSIAADGSTNSAYLPLKSLHAIEDAARLTLNTKIQRDTVESYLDKTLGSSKQASAAVTGYVRSKMENTKLVTLAPRVAPVFHYQFLNCPSEHKEEAKEILAVLMKPFALSSYAPLVTRGNEVESIVGRVTSIQHTAPLKLSRKTWNYMVEFVERLVVDKHSLVPATPDMVLERQPRPAQRRILEQASLLGRFVKRTIVKAFMKREAYGGLKTPRNISTVPGREKATVSAITYPLAEMLKKHRGYAFSKSPRDIGNHVAQCCVSSKYVVLSDYSRMDGRCSNVGHMLYTAVLMRAFHPDYHAHVQSSVNSILHLDGYTTHGVKYNALWSRLSGEPGTSLKNTLENMFIAYSAYRIDGRDANEAFSEVNRGMYGGDDAITPDVPQDTLCKAAKFLGHVMTAETIPFGASGVNFLNRYFGPEVWHGWPASISDPRRHIMKFHTSKMVPGHQRLPRLAAKCLSYRMTDPASPVIGPFTKRFLDLYDGKIDDERSWWATFSIDNQFTPPHSREEWPVTLLKEQIPGFDLDAYTDWLESCTSIEELVNCPGFLDDPAGEPPQAPDGKVVAVKGFGIQDMRTPPGLGGQTGCATTTTATLCTTTTTTTCTTTAAARTTTATRPTRPPLRRPYESKRSDGEARKRRRGKRAGRGRARK